MLPEVYFPGASRCNLLSMASKLCKCCEWRFCPASLHTHNTPGQTSQKRVRLALRNLLALVRAWSPHWHALVTSLSQCQERNAAALLLGTTARSGALSAISVCCHPYNGASEKPCCGVFTLLSNHTFMLLSHGAVCSALSCPEEMFMFSWLILCGHKNLTQLL